MKKIVLLIAGLMGSGVLLAFPTPEEIKVAGPVVGELVASDVKAANSGKAKHAEVAAKIEPLVDQAKGGAAKWLLLKHAFIQYAKGADYAKASAVMDRILSVFPDVPPETALGLIERNANRANRTNAARLLAQRELLSVRQKCTSIAADPKADKLQRVEALCVLGNWEKGLAAFARLGGAAGEMARAEQDGSKSLNEIANFWWGYTSKLDTLGVFKAHAASLYQKGIADGSIDGLYRTIAEKRIAQCDPQTVAAAGVASAVAAPSGRSLLHRWSFNRDFKDSVSGKAFEADPNMELKDGVVRPKVLGAEGAYCRNLGADLLPPGEFTLEIWSRLLKRSPVDLVFWSKGQNIGEFVLNWNHSNASRFGVQGRYTKLPLLEENRDYHFIIRGRKNAKGTYDFVLDYAKVGDRIEAPRATVTDVAWAGKIDPFQISARKDTYDEIRVWDHALKDEEIAESHRLGPDRLPMVSEPPSAAPASAVRLAHRWRSDHDFRDELGAAPAKRTPGKDARIDLGPGLLSFGRDFTMEIWARLEERVDDWYKLYSLHYPGRGKPDWNNDFCLNWCMKGKPDTSRFKVPGSRDNAPWFFKIEPKRDYHFIVTGRKNAAGKMDVQLRYAKAQDAEITALPVVKDVVWPEKTEGLLIGLGHASCREIRIWDGVLSDEEIRKTQKLGPEKLP